MEIGRRSWMRWLRLIVTVAALTTWWQMANADPQTNELGDGCSSKTAKNVPQFMKNLNDALSDLRTQLSSPSEEKRFATAEYNNTENQDDHVYGMAQCRNYMSKVDCVACFDAAEAVIRTNCSNKNVTGARVAKDGCFLRYEAYNFYERSSDSWLLCGNETTSEATANYVKEGEKLLRDLQVATPRIFEKNGVYFGASKRKVGGSTIYGVAQCVDTVSQDGCRGCLSSAYETLRVCFSSTDGRLVDAACFMRYSTSSFFLDNQTTDLTPFLRGSSTNLKAVIGGTVGGSGLLVIVVTLFIWFNFSRTLKKALIGNILGATELQRPNIYSYKDLKAATNNFSEENKLGKGAFGAVYKATLTNETVVAVKKLDISYSRAKADYEAEVRLISNVHHRNLVRLLGCCSKGSELLLVYEYMKNASLDRFLYGENRGTLNWKQRCDIILGIARGIAYLHEHYYVTILHRDIKPSNILLDDEFEAKIADFGLARLLPESDQSHVSTNFAGTLGYTAPEYPVLGHLSDKVDIYSFGIVILEVISGRRCTDVHTNVDESTTEYLLQESWKLYERGMHENLADEALGRDEYDVEDVKKMVEIALLCVQSQPSSRPNMSQLILMISSVKSIGHERGFTIRRPSLSYGNVEINVNENGSLPSSIDKSKSTGSDASFTPLLTARANW